MLVFALVLIAESFGNNGASTVDASWDVASAVLKQVEKKDNALIDHMEVIAYIIALLLHVTALAGLLLATIFL